LGNSQAETEYDAKDYPLPTPVLPEQRCYRPFASTAM
jgi:hypothetical protein